MIATKALKSVAVALVAVGFVFGAVKPASARQLPPDGKLYRECVNWLGEDRPPTPGDRAMCCVGAGGAWVVIFDDRTGKPADGFCVLGPKDSDPWALEETDQPVPVDPRVGSYGSELEQTDAPQQGETRVGSYGSELEQTDAAASQVHVDVSAPAYASA